MNAKELKVHIYWPSWKATNGSEKMCIAATMDGQRIEGLPQNTSYEEINSAFYSATGVFLPFPSKFGYYYSHKKMHGLARGVYDKQTRCYKWEAMDRTYEQEAADFKTLDMATFRVVQYYTKGGKHGKNEGAEHQSTGSVVRQSERGRRKEKRFFGCRRSDCLLPIP